MPYTLYLDDRWDITLDGAGRLKTADGAYAVAQNVANAVRLFTEDAFYDWDRGIPHFDIELKPRPSAAVLRARIREAAMGVEGVLSATVELDEIDRSTRELTGEVELTTTDGERLSVAF